MEYFNETFKSDSIMNVNEVSLYLRIPCKTVYRLAKQGKIKGVKLGKHWRFLKEDIYYYLRYGRNKSTLLLPHKLVERRAYPRINCNFPCQYTINLLPFRNISSEGIVKDLCAEGIFLIGQNEDINKIEINDPIDLQFFLFLNNDQKVNVKAKCKVLRKTQDGFGVRFKEIENGIQNIIMEYAA